MSTTDFNKYAKEFLIRMEESFPQEPKIKQYNFQFDMIRKMNSRKPVEMFMESLAPFGLKIMTKDEQFFHKEKYVENVQTLSGKMGLVNYWENMPKQSRESIWHYIQALYVLGMGALGRKDELKIVLDQVHFKNSS
jgi:glycyl-tRNA synthetase alpha subunit